MSLDTRWCCKSRKGRKKLSINPEKDSKAINLRVIAFLLLIKSSKQIQRAWFCLRLFISISLTTGNTRRKREKQPHSKVSLYVHGKKRVFVLILVISKPLLYTKQITVKKVNCIFDYLWLQTVTSDSLSRITVFTACFCPRVYSNVEVRTVMWEVLSAETLTHKVRWTKTETGHRHSRSDWRSRRTTKTNFILSCPLSSGPSYFSWPYKMTSLMKGTYSELMMQVYKVLLNIIQWKIR